MSNTSLTQFDFNGSSIKVLMINGNPCLRSPDPRCCKHLGSGERKQGVQSPKRSRKAGAKLEGEGYHFK